eukprot:TRINITY_DN7591_c0_g1_i1.p1 TRINITY_DN7591_c0_g1~~TRINITY_DN7591_c0_g1_i1.p1  ORF type:complete len:704 (+),score=171.62 TRINITY_DN7591_c0_g1_i1:121-2232(+)
MLLRPVLQLLMVVLVCEAGTKSAGRSIGIDLGSEIIRAAYKEGKNGPRLALNSMSDRFFPSTVGWRGTERQLCEGARGKLDIQVAGLRDLVSGYNGSSDSEYKPQEILAMALQHVVTHASDSQKNGVVVTIPSYVSQHGRIRIIDACRISGMRLNGLVTEHAAAAVGYSTSIKPSVKRLKVLFVHISASTTQVTAVRYNRKVNKLHIRVLSNTAKQHGTRDLQLGLLEKLKENHPELANHLTEDTSSFPLAFKNLKKLTEVLTVKKDASGFILQNPEIPISITRDDLENVNGGYFEMLENMMAKCIKNAKWTIDDIDAVELVGGGSRMPILQERIAEYVKPVTLGHQLDKDEAIALGAAVVSANITKPEPTSPQLTDVTTKKFVIEVVADSGDQLSRQVIPSFTPIPTKVDVDFKARPGLDHCEVVISTPHQGVVAAYKLLNITSTAANLADEQSAAGMSPDRSSFILSVRSSVRSDGLVEISRAKVSLNVTKILERKKKKGQQPMSKKVVDVAYSTVPFEMVSKSVSMSDEELAESARLLRMLQLDDDRRVSLTAARNDLEQLLYQTQEILDNYEGDKTEFDNLQSTLKDYQEWVQSDLPDEVSESDFNIKVMEIRKKSESLIEATTPAEPEESEEPESGADSEPEGDTTDSGDDGTTADDPCKLVKEELRIAEQKLAKLKEKMTVLGYDTELEDDNTDQPT